MTQIVLFKPDDSWVLVVMQFLDGSELVNNDSHRFVYDRDARQFSEIKYNRTVGRYTFEEFDRLVKERGMVSEFSPYEFKMEKE